MEDSKQLAVSDSAHSRIDGQAKDAETKIGSPDYQEVEEHINLDEEALGDSLILR